MATQVETELERAHAVVGPGTSPSHAIDVSSPTDDEAHPGWIETLRIISAGYSFFVAGVSDGSIGTLIPYIIDSYGINTAIVSSVYGASFFGWLFAGVTNSYLAKRFDLGAMMVLGCVFQLLASALRIWNPPFAFYAVTFFIISIGQAYQDTYANAFVAETKQAHRWLGFIHAMYSCGCLVGPFIANAIAAYHIPHRWYLFYAAPLGFSVLNLLFVIFAFRSSIRMKKPSRHASQGQTLAELEAKSPMKATLKLPPLWLLSLFYFFYLGAALTAGGWAVQYLVDVRAGDLTQMGYVPAGINGGSFIGRLFLPELAQRLGDRRTVFGFIIISIGLQLCFWLVPNVIGAAVCISLFGVFSGPLFPIAMSRGKKILPQHLQQTALGFVFVAAQIGGCLFPIMTGALANAKGVWVLQPMLVGLLAATAISWLLVPSPKDNCVPAVHDE